MGEAVRLRYVRKNVSLRQSFVTAMHIFIVIDISGYIALGMPVSGVKQEYCPLRPTLFGVFMDALTLSAG